MKLINILISFFTVTSLSFSLADAGIDKDCSSLFSGIKINLLNQQKLSKNEIGTFFLGEGHTAKVYRVISDHEVHVEKIYKEQRHLENDLLAESYLAENLFNGRKIVASYRRDHNRSNVIIVSDFRGKDVESLSNELNDPEAKRALVSLYNKQHEAWVAQIDSLATIRYTIYSKGTQILPSGLLRTNYEIEDKITGKSFYIYLKPDNVLVSEDMELKIIDAH